jgi:Domain of unknown function (DUF4327)
MTTKQVAYPMVKFQRKAASLVESKVMKSSDNIWKLALLYGDEWPYWKQELLDFGFSMNDTVNDILVVEQWDEDL